MAQTYFKKLFMLHGARLQALREHSRLEHHLPTQKVAQPSDESIKWATESVAEQQILWASILVYNVTFIRCHASIDLPSEISVDNTEAHDIDKRLVKEVLDYYIC